MEELQNKARALLESGAVKVVIGFAAGTEANTARPLFARTPQQAGKLVWGENCKQNLATYLLKPEVKALGKVAVVGRVPMVRTVMQYAAESQITDEAAVLLAVSDDGQVTELSKFEDIEVYLAKVPRGLSPEAQAEIERIQAMPLEQRWAFWSAEMSRCIKCYACRAACPMCYCARCITEVNQPQWIPVAADRLGNLEWNIVRAMHLAGRCVDCGSCSDACPQGIRLDLLNRVLAQEVLTSFGGEPGYSTRKEYALSTFKPDDKEEFIR
jgi:ferredoxin